MPIVECQHEPFCILIPIFSTPIIHDQVLDFVMWIPQLVYDSLDSEFV